jgi:hypothetical protein
MDEGINLGEPSCFHIILDMMKVDDPSSMMQRWMVVFLILIGIYNVTKDGSRGYALSKSNVIRQVSMGSTTPNCGSNSFHWEGDV